MVKNINSILFQDISQDILKNERAEYGDETIKNLSKKLTENYGRGFNTRNLFKMVRFYKQFPDEQIVASLRPLLSWTHFRELIMVEDALKRQFYTEMCRIKHWSVRELRAKIDGMLYERTAISHQAINIAQEKLIETKHYS